MLTQLYVFLLLAVIGINSWQLKLDNKENFVMRVRQDSYVTCHVVLDKDESDDILPTITWYKDGIEVLPLKTSSRGLTKKDIFSKTLYLKNPTYQDNGHYSCSVIVGNQTKMLAVDLNFKVGAKFVNTPIEQYAVNGTQARIQCNVAGDDVTIEWLKNGAVIKENWKYSTENEGQILVITLYYARDSGVYQCRWNQDDTYGILNIRVITYEKPAILRFDPVKTAIEGQDFEMKCIANGKPAPNVRWYKMTEDKVGIQSDYYEDTKNGSLILHDVRASDAGWYLCEAEGLSRFDKDSRMIRVDVMGKPKIDLIKKIVAKSGENVTLQCQFHGDGRFHARWIKNVEIQAEKVFPVSNKTQSLNLTLTDVGYEEMGVYRCEVSNDVGTVANSTMLYVNVPPTIINEAHRNFSVVPPTNVTLSCSAVAYPVPTWNWYFSNETTTKLDLKNSTYAKITATENGGSKLNIPEFLADHLGNYTCEARNANGNDRAVISLVKKVPPSVPSLKCYVGNTQDSLRCVDDNAFNGTTEEGLPRSYIVYYVEEKTSALLADCCSNGTTLKNCLAVRQNVTNDAGYLWIYNMKPTTKYILQVAAENEAGESEVSECIWIATAASTSTPLSLVAIILYVIAVVALILLIDLLCCLERGKGMFAALYRRFYRLSNDQTLPTDIVEESQSGQSPIIEEQEVVYESNVVRTGSNSALKSPML